MWTLQSFGHGSMACRVVTFVPWQYGDGGAGVGPAGRQVSERGVPECGAPDRPERAEHFPEPTERAELAEHVLKRAEGSATAARARAGDPVIGGVGAVRGFGRIAPFAHSAPVVPK